MSCYSRRVVPPLHSSYSPPPPPPVIITRFVYQRRIHRGFAAAVTLSYPGSPRDRSLDRTGSNWIGAVGSRDVRVTSLGRWRKRYSRIDRRALFAKRSTFFLHGEPRRFLFGQKFEFLQAKFPRLPRILHSDKFFDKCSTTSDAFFCV